MDKKDSTESKETLKTSRETVRPAEEIQRDEEALDMLWELSSNNTIDEKLYTDRGYYIPQSLKKEETKDAVKEELRESKKSDAVAELKVNKYSAIEKNKNEG
jgi:hypothetical protein